MSKHLFEQFSCELLEKENLRQGIESMFPESELIVDQYVSDYLFGVTSSPHFRKGLPASTNTYRILRQALRETEIERLMSHHE